MKCLAILLFSLPVAANAAPIDFSDRSGDRAFESDLWYYPGGNDNVNGELEAEIRGHGRPIEQILAKGKHELCFDCWNPRSNENAWIVKLPPLVSNRNQAQLRDEIVLDSAKFGFDSMMNPDFDDGRPFDPEEPSHRVSEPSTLALLGLGLAAIGFAGRPRRLAPVRPR